MAQPGSRPHVDHEVVVFVVIAGAIGCALWDVHGVSEAIATAQPAPGTGVAAPVRATTRPPIAAASASAAAPASVVLAGLAH